MTYEALIKTLQTTIKSQNKTIEAKSKSIESLEVVEKLQYTLPSMGQYQPTTSLLTSQGTLRQSLGLKSKRL